MNQGATNSVFQTTVQRSLLRLVLRSRRLVHAPMLTAVHKKEDWNFHTGTATGHPMTGDRGRKPVSAEAIEKVALQVKEDKASNVHASTSVRLVAEALDLSHSTVQKIMRNILRYYPYKLQFVQELLPHDFETRHLFSLKFLARLEFYEMFLTFPRTHCGQR
ncbi:uncharacterized protein TNCV_4844561 [Trichonephila clavipes]|uniref:Uncharacterized protein n=1 Tax=Trichonephila clavipes TaxID=2585209 RepID=A0A8X6WJD5_TRICX|nr:uncharacterized protein TNCV_4844561 [Trichonephila clavipes]